MNLPQQRVWKKNNRCFQNASAIIVRRVFSLSVAVFMSELSSGLFWSEWKRRAAASPSRHRHTNPYLFFVINILCFSAGWRKCFLCTNSRLTHHRTMNAGPFIESGFSCISCFVFDFLFRSSTVPYWQTMARTICKVEVELLNESSTWSSMRLKREIGLILFYLFFYFEPFWGKRAITIVWLPWWEVGASFWLVIWLSDRWCVGTDKQSSGLNGRKRSHFLLLSIFPETLLAFLAHAAS